MLDSADVVVIGGGAIGTSVAYYLAREGVDVILLDRGDIAAGTSSRCNGGVVTGYEPWSALISYSNDLHRSLAEEIDFDFKYRREGSYRLLETEQDWELMSKLVADQSRRGLKAEMISASEIHAREKGIASDIVGAVEYPLDATLNPYLYCWALARQILSLGARIYRFTEVAAIELDKRAKIRRVCTSQGNIPTTNVVNAAGCWAPCIGKMVGIEIPIIPCRGQILVTEMTDRLLGMKKLNEAGGLRKTLQKSPADAEEGSSSPGIAFVYEHTVDGNILLGSSREFIGYDVRTTPEVIRAIAKRAVRFVPGLKRLNCIRTFAGIRPFTPDHLPIISAAHIQGFYVAAGHEGVGIGLAPLTGKVISELIRGEKTCIGVERFSLSRFASKESDEISHAYV